MFSRAPMVPIAMSFQLLAQPLRPSAFVALLAVMGAPLAVADVTVPERTGLVAEPVAVEVVRGNEITIPLRAAGARAAVIEFSIVEGGFPQAGGLGEIVPGPAGATVIYRSDPSSALKIDRFRFQAKTTDGSKPPSSGTVVTINIIEPEAVLDVQKDLDFGRVAKDGAMIKDLMVRNIGTGAFDGKLELEAPFAIVGDARLRVPVGGVKVISVRFTPGGETRPVKQEWVIQRGNPNASVHLSGRGFAPFSTSVTKVQLQTDRETWERRATVTVENPGEEDIILRIKAPARVTVEPDQVAELLAGSSIDIDLKIPNTDVTAFDGELLLSEKSYGVEIPISAEPAPARVRVVDPEPGRPLLFDGKFGETLTAQVTMQNAGGKMAFISAMASKPFRVLEGEEGRPLGPEESMRFTVELKPDRIGPMRDRLRIHGGERLITIPLEGEITLPPGMEAPPPPPEPEPGERRPGTIPTAFLVDGDAEIRRVDRKMPTVDVISPGAVSEDSVSFSWKHPGGNNDWDYVVETETHRFDESTGIPYPHWVELGDEHVEISLDASKAKATVKGLKPGGKYVFRILTVDGARYSPPGRRLTFVTVAEQRFLPWLKLWMVAGGAAAILLLVVLWKRARAQQYAYG